MGFLYLREGSEPPQPCNGSSGSASPPHCVMAMVMFMVIFMVMLMVMVNGSGNGNVNGV